jgi:hypothetical protein
MFFDFENFQKPGLGDYITKPKNCPILIFRGQSELAPVNTPPRIFSLGSRSPTNLSIAEGSKSVPRVQKLGFIQLDAWSEPAATNAPVQDEPIEAVLRMNKNPILLARMDFFFSPLLCPKISPPPTYHLPTPPPLTPSPELQRRRAGTSLELEPGLLEQELGVTGAWRLELLEQGSCGWSRSGTHAGPN